MFKRAILTILFFVLTTGIFGALTARVDATDINGANCQTAKGWPGTCSLSTSCLQSLGAGYAWDDKAAPCNTVFGWGCCGTSPVVATSCQTTQGWPGSCTVETSCINSLSATTAWDDTVAPCNTLPGSGLTRYGCCGLLPVCHFAGPTGSPTRIACDACMNKGKGSWTALGCIPTDPQQFIGQILGIAVGIGGGIAFLLILFGGFQILMSAGNPEKLNAGKELVTSAITGLLIIIFSIFILRLIGVSIFGIPGFQ